MSNENAKDANEKDAFEGSDEADLFWKFNLIKRDGISSSFWNCSYLKYSFFTIELNIMEF